MKLTAPKVITFAVALLLAVIALVCQVAIVAFAPYAFWLMLIAFVVLALGNFVRGM